MAIYTTFFLCVPKELHSGFPGWKKPLAKPVRREVRNFLTGQLIAIQTREPEWGDEESDEPQPPRRVVSIKGRYKDYLETRLPPFVRDCPHWAAKDLTELEISPLIEAVGLRSGLEPALYSPPSRSGFVQVFPSAFPTTLGTIDQPHVAHAWAAVMSSPEYAETADGEMVSDGWTATTALSVLKPLTALAERATKGQRLYLLTET
jgi:hypothetical protein